MLREVSRKNGQIRQCPKMLNLEILPSGEGVGMDPKTPPGSAPDSYFLKKIKTHRATFVERQKIGV